MLRITSKDGKTFEASQEIRQMSKLIDDSLMESSENAEITCNEVEGKFIEMIIDYCKHYNFQKTKTDIAHPLISKDPNVYITDAWERTYITALSLDDTCELLQGANYFNIPAIFELCCAAIAAFFKGKDFDKIKGDFGL